MMPMSDVVNETYLADQWLYENLLADATLVGLIGSRFYADEAPASAVYPYVMWNLISATDVRGQGTFRIMVNCLYLVKVVGKATSYGALMPASDRIHAAIDAKGGDTIAGDHVFSCVREEPYRLSVSSSGVSYRHLGGIFRIHVQKG